MNIAEIRKLEEEYQNCELCNLCKNRKVNTHFGMGHPDGKAILVIPEPLLGREDVMSSTDFYDNGPIQKNHRIYRTLSTILKSVHIDSLDLYVISAVMCPPIPGERPTQEEVLACRERLIKTVQTYNPKMLILSGAISYFSWYTKLPEDKNTGILYDEDGKTIYYTRDLEAYTKAKESNEYSSEIIEGLAQEIFTNWQQIAEILKR